MLLSTGRLFGIDGGAAGAAATLTATDERTTTSTNPSFATVAIGADVPGRTVFVSLTDLRSGVNGTAPSALTIGGVSASKVGEKAMPHSSSATRAFVQIWQATGVSGTTGTVAYTSPNDRHTICVYSVVGLLSTTPVDTASADSQVGGATISAPVGSLAGGVVLAGVVCLEVTDDGTIGADGMSEDYEISAGSAHRGWHLSLATASARTVTPTYTDPDTHGRAILALAFR